MTAAIRTLGPALLAPPDAPVMVEPANGLVKAGARAYRGGVYIVAVNAGYVPASATIEAPGLDGRRLAVVGSGRVVIPSGDSFSERFAPLEARVYVATPGTGSP